MAGALKDVQRQKAASPDAIDFVKEAKAKVTFAPGGQEWEGVVTGRENIKRAVEMMNGSRKIEVERGQKLQASRPVEKLVNRYGVNVPVPEHLVDAAKRKAGLRTAGRAGGTRTLMTGGWLPNARDRAAEADE